MYYNIKIINSFIAFIVLSLVFKIIKTGSLKSKLVLQEKTYLFRTSLYLAASASAEFFADIALAPMEAVKVRIQTQPGWANNLREGAPKLWAEEGIRGYVDFWKPKNNLASRLDYQLLFGEWACPGEGRGDREMWDWTHLSVGNQTYLSLVAVIWYQCWKFIQFCITGLHSCKIMLQSHQSWGLYKDILTYKFSIFTVHVQDLLMPNELDLLDLWSFLYSSWPKSISYVRCIQGCLGQGK